MVGVSDFAWLSANAWFHAALVLCLFAALGWIFQNVLIVTLKRLTAKTETDIDDILMHIAARPLFFLILLIGAYLATLVVRDLDAYRGFVNGTFYVLIVALLAWLGARIIAFLTTRWFQAHRGLSGSPRLLNIIAGVVIWLIAFIMVLAHFDVEITPFIATLGVGGLAVGLALQGTLSNIFAGMHIIGDQPIRVGDFIEVEDGKVSGFVDDIGWRSTRIKTQAGNIVIIPNGKLAESTIQNISMPDPHVPVGVTCGVAYDSDLVKVEKVTLDVARSLQGSIAGATVGANPVVRFSGFGDSNIDFTVWIPTDGPTDRFLVKHEFIKRLHARYNKEGIEISWPVRKIVTAPSKKRK